MNQKTTFFLSVPPRHQPLPLADQTKPSPRLEQPASRLPVPQSSLTTSPPLLRYGTAGSGPYVQSSRRQGQNQSHPNPNMLPLRKVVNGEPWAGGGVGIIRGHVPVSVSDLAVCKDSADFLRTLTNS